MNSALQLVPELPPVEEFLDVVEVGVQAQIAGMVSVTRMRVRTASPARQIVRKLWRRELRVAPVTT